MRGRRALDYDVGAGTASVVFGGSTIIAGASVASRPSATQVQYVTAQFSANYAQAADALGNLVVQENPREAPLESLTPAGGFSPSAIFSVVPPAPAATTRPQLPRP